MNSIPSLSDARHFVPVLARAIELGEGPPSVLHWIRGRERQAPLDSSPDGLRRLAGELASDVRRAQATKISSSSTLLFNRHNTYVYAGAERA